MRDVVNSSCVCAVLVFICFGVYHNSLDNEFVFDDHLAIVNNADTDPTTPFPDLWKHDIWGKDLRAHDSHRSYRPLLIATFKFLRSQFGLDARSIRVASILSHAVCSIMVFFLGKQVASNWHISLASSLLFALHPVHVESVAAVVNIAEPLSCAFFCACLMGYLGSTEETDTVTDTDTDTDTDTGIVTVMGTDTDTGTGTGTGAEKSPSRRPLLSLLVTGLLGAGWVTFFAVSVLFKETAVTVLGVVFGISAATMVSMVLRKWKCFLSPGQLVRKPTATSLRCHAGWMLLSLVLLVAYFVFRAAIVAPDSAPPGPLAQQCGGGSHLLATVRSLASKSESLLEMVRNSVLMLRHLLFSPLVTLRGMVMGAQSSSGVSSTKVDVDVSSFYLDDSALIRKAENPFAFLAGREKALSLLYLHLRYLLLLLWPVQLSAEYAFNCIPAVTSWEDEGQYRAVYALAMYVVLLGTVLCGLAAMVRGGGGGGQVSSQATLVSVVLMVVPFIPAAGVFLRLGTLLAERLLYVPSIGFCYLLCIFLLLTCKQLCRAMRLPDRSGSRAASMFWGLVLALSAFYALRTHRRNLDWRTDADLFLASLDVCPSSAKLNLQVTKLYVNRGDFASAERHIAAAKKIDPEFCDVWYQEALVSLLHYNDVARGKAQLADSLECVFTSQGALQLLQSIWDQELQRTPKDYKIHLSIADTAFKAGMVSVAAQYYQQGAVLATEQEKLTDALKMSQKTEKAVKQFLAVTSFDSEENSRGKVSYHFREMACNMYGLGAIIRSRLSEYHHADALDDALGRPFSQSKPEHTRPKKKPKKAASAGVLRQLDRRDKFIAEALRPKCVYEQSSSREMLVETSGVRDITLSSYALTVLNLQVGILSAKVQRIQRALLKSGGEGEREGEGEWEGAQPSSLQTLLAKHCTALAELLQRGGALHRKTLALKLGRYYENMISLQAPLPGDSSAQRKVSEAHSAEVQRRLEKEVLEAKASRLAAESSSLRLYVDAGEALFHTGNYSLASSLFHRAVHATSSSEHGDVTVERGAKEEFVTAGVVWLEEVIAEKDLAPPAEVPCRAHYWHARALETARREEGDGEAPPMVYDVALRTEVRAHLSAALSCLAAEGEGGEGVMQRYARQQLAEIDLVLRHAEGELEDP